MKISDKKVIGLVRVSTDQQADDDRAGLPRQHYEIQRVVTTHKLRLLEVVEFKGVSGTVTHEMPEIHRILRLVREREIDGIVVADLDRLFRLKNLGDFAILEAFQDARATIWTGSGEFDFGGDSGATMAVISGLFTGLELRAIKRRILGARAEKRKRGELGGAKLLLPTGIDYDYTTKVWSTTPDIVKVQEAFRLVDEDGETNLAEISRRLGVDRATLKNWLKNKLYMGIRRIDQKRGDSFPAPRRGTVIIAGKRRDRVKVDRDPGDVIERHVIENPPVSSERWHRVQEKMASTRQRRGKQTAGRGQVNLGSGLLVCGYCNETVYATSGINKKHPNRSGYYYCRQNHYLAKRKGRLCPQPNLRKAEVDRLLTDFVGNCLTRPETLKSIISNYDQREEVIPDLAPMFAELDRREERILRLYENGTVVRQNVVEKRLDAIEAERQRLKNLTEDADRRRREAVRREDMLRSVVRGALAFRRMADVSERKAVLNGLLSTVVLKNASIIAFSAQPEIELLSPVAENRNRTGRGSSPRRA